MLLSRAESRYFKACAREILSFPLVQTMKKFPQHGKTNCLCHVIMVAENSYWLALQQHRRLGVHIDYRAVIRGALLHDFFLYDWHDPHNGHRFHGLSHPYTAYDNASKYFYLNPIERDIIRKHMFPLTPIPPRYLESLLVSFVDKICSIQETFSRRSPRTAGVNCPFARHPALAAGKPEPQTSAKGGAAHAVCSQ